MDGVDLKWLEWVVKESGYDISKLVSYELVPAVADGENYVSKVVRMTVQARSVDGSPRELSFILKRKLEMELDDQNMKEKISEAFTVEYRVYDTILSQLVKYLPDGENKMWANCLGTIPDKDIYFEDLKMSGYSVASRQNGLDYDQTLLVFENLAKLHAISSIAIDNGDIDVSSYKVYLMLGSIDHKIETNEFEMMTDVILKEWGEGWEETADRLNQFKDNFFETVYNLGIFDESRLNVFNHGDTWVNNFMFKYDSSGRPDSVKLVDFQIATYNSFGFDLSYLLNSSVDCALKEKHLDTWVEAYCAIFRSHLGRHGSSLTCPTPSMVSKELERLAPFGLMIALRNRPIFMASPEQFLTIPEIMENSGVDTKKRRIYTNPSYIRNMKTDLPSLLSDIESLNKDKS